MPQVNAEKVQPWKAMPSLEENVEPNGSDLKLFYTGNDGPRPQGASVSKPIDRKTQHEEQH